MTRLLSISLFSWALIGLTFAGPAFAQDDPGGLLEGDLLEEKKPAEKPVLDDPDAKLLKEVETARGALEKRLNPLQEKVAGFPKIDKKLQKIMSGWLKATDGFVEPHATALEAYRTAIKDNLPAVKDKQAKVIAKARTGFLKKIKKLSKKVDTLEKKLDKAIAKSEQE